MAKMYTGNTPPAEKGWLEIHICQDTDQTEWTVYRKPQSHTQEWADYKIVATGKVSRKANYWLSFNSRTEKFSLSRDLGILQANRPKLFSIIQHLCGIAAT